MLRSGGAEEFVPFKGALITENPNDAMDYAKNVQTVVDGLNGKVNNIEKYVKKLGNDKEVNERIKNIKEKGTIFSNTKTEIGKIKTNINKVKNLTSENKQKMQESLIGLHGKQIDILFGELKTSLSGLNGVTNENAKKFLSEISVVDNFKPTGVNDVMTKAKILVNTSEKYISDIEEKGDAATTEEKFAIVMTDELLTKLKDFMSIHASNK
jgi:hypothetical protein